MTSVQPIITSKIVFILFGGKIGIPNSQSSEHKNNQM